MPYQPISGSSQTCRVPQHPSFADEKEFHRLLVSASTEIVPSDQKEQICEKWRWDPDVECTEEVSGYIDYHRALARVVFEDISLEGVDPERLRPGVIQEARQDFIAGCRGRTNEPGGGWSEALQSLVTSLTGPSDTDTTTETSPPTAGR